MSRRPVLIPSIEIALALRRAPRMVLCEWDGVWREVKPLRRRGLLGWLREVLRCSS